MASLDTTAKLPAFHLSKMWISGRIAFKPGLADIVRLSGDLRMTVGGGDVPGFAAGEDGISINDCLNQLHYLLYPGAVDVAVTTRDLKDERAIFKGKGGTTFLRVINGRNRAIPGFERIPLDHGELVKAVCDLERRVRDLLETMTTRENAADWWQATTNVPIERAGLVVSAPIKKKSRR